MFDYLYLYIVMWVKTPQSVDIIVFEIVRFLEVHNYRIGLYYEIYITQSLLVSLQTGSINLETYKLADIKFEDIAMGQSASFTHQLTQLDVDNFATLTGDVNPLHTDAKFAQGTQFKTPIAHGLLVQSFLSTLVGMYLPGKYCLILDIKSQFRKPVHIGETITISGTVTKKQQVGKLLTIAASIKNNLGEIVVNSQIIVSVRDE